MEPLQGPEIEITPSVISEVARLIESGTPHAEDDEWKFYGPLQNFPRYFVRVPKDPDRKTGQGGMEFPVDIGDVMAWIVSR